MIDAKYIHTNLIAHDWKKLAFFYQNVFGCQILPDERDLKGDWLDRLTSIEAVHICGAHLRLPGVEGLTLELFQYNQLCEADSPAVNRPGFSHIAFLVDDVEGAVEEVLAAGGGKVGEVVKKDVPGLGMIVVAYVTDPEGNVVELQSRG